MLLLSVFSCALAEEIPVGFKVERYRRLWERNPFVEAKAATPQVRSSVFDKLFLASWLIDAGKEVVCVQNSETDEVQRITAEPNQNNLRLVGIHLSSNPQVVEAVISDGKEQGTVKFRLGDQSPLGPAPSAAIPLSNSGATAQQPKSAENAPQKPRPAVNLPNAQPPGSPTSVPVNQRPPHRGTPVFRPGVG
jgi:hypothetical protein